MADPDPMTCDPGSRVYDPDPGTVIPDPIYLVTTLKLRARGERQLRGAIKRFREEGGNYSSKLENATSQDYSQDVSARTVSHFLNF